ncbi:MAG: zinc ABC transporter substrate-binding protein [Prevotella sp.]|nr:zinc ABC transporter substrate-binding protein [Prevotella sp.]
MIDSIIAFLMNYGYVGMMIAAFLAASILPFSSEAVMVGLLAAGLDLWALVAWGTVGNVLGSLFNYGIGRMGKMEWIEKYLHTKPKDLERAKRFMGGRGAWMGLFSCIPVLGDVITIVLGLMRANFPIFVISVTISKLVRYVILMMAAGTVVSCTSPHVNEEKTITVSIEPLRYFTESIAGDRFTVKTMVPQGSSPETYEPTARQMTDLANSVVYIKVGDLGFERTWMTRLTANAPHISVVNSSEGISREGLDSDPHVWMSAANATVICNNIYQALRRIDAKDSLYYRHRLDSIVNVIHNTDDSLRSLISASGMKSFVIYHPALTYFARDYGLKQIAVEREGHEPSAADLQRVINEARANHTDIMYVQKEFSNRNIDVITDAIKARHKVINPLGYNWPEEMLCITRQ